MLTWSHHPLHLVDLQNSSKWDFANTYCLLHYVCGTIVVTWSYRYYVVVTETSVQEVTECHATDGAVGGQYSWNNQSIVKKKNYYRFACTPLHLLTTNTFVTTVIY